MAGYQDVLRLSLGDPSGDHSHPYFRHQLDGYPRPRVGRFEIVDELSQILNGVNVVVGRRGDETHSLDGVTSLGNVLRHLLTKF